MKKSGLADSPFFTLPQQTEEVGTPPPAISPLEKQPIKVKPKKKRRSVKTAKTSNRDTTTPRYHETTVSRYHDTIIELVRKAVRELGKEAATHRFTVNEKKAIADIIYTYKNQGVRTSENEIARISVNFIVEDYRQNGENSILERALRALNE